MSKFPLTVSRARSTVQQRLFKLSGKIMTGKYKGKQHWLVLLVFAVLNFVSAAYAVSPNIVISQVYGGGGNTGATYKNDFIELFNRG
ncbi:MAG: hypothetical protein ABL925_16240, partial [Methylococcales bacterium]